MNKQEKLERLTEVEEEVVEFCEKCNIQTETWFPEDGYGYNKCPECGKENQPCEYRDDEELHTYFVTKRITTEYFKQVNQ